MACVAVALMVNVMVPTTEFIAATICDLETRLIFTSLLCVIVVYYSYIDYKINKLNDTSIPK